MKPQTIRRLDYAVGVPLCAVLTAVRRLVDLFPRRAAPPRPGKILVLKLVEQGATVLAWSALQRAAAMVGKENVYFLVLAENRPVLDLMGLVPPENVLVLRQTSLITFGLDLLRTLLRLRRLGVDATIDMEFFARAPAIIAYLSGARRRVGLHRFTSEGPYRGDLLTHRVQQNPYLHTSVAYELLVAALEHDSSDLPMLKLPAPTTVGAPPAFVPSEPERTEVGELLAREFGTSGGAAGGMPGPLVLLNPNASDMLPLRRWPLERFTDLGRRLLERHPDLRIGVTGGPGERDAGQALASSLGSPRAISLAGKTTFRQLLVLYTLADVLVTNDSGPGHFATLTGIHAIVLFGPETPALFGPLGPNATVLWAGLACSPCVNAYNHRHSPCRNNRCMQAITVEQVDAQVEAALAGRKKPGDQGAMLTSA